MPRGLTEYRKRNSIRNETRALLTAAANAFNKNQIEINKIFRLDFASGIVEEVTVSGFRFQLIFDTSFEKLDKFAPYSSVEKVAREQMENFGAHLFTDKAEYWVEKVKIEPAKNTFAAAA
jgi:hypothetical protein